MFPHGVASGDPLTDRVLLWTRVTTGEPAVDLEWRVASDPGMQQVVATGTATARADRDHTVQVDVTGLAPGTTYWYRFDAGGESSIVGRTRTLPGPASRVRFVISSCAKFNAGFFNAYARVADRDDIDFVLHLGDYIYEASNTPPASQTPGADIGRPFDPRHECVTAADYRTRYAQYRLDPDVQAVHAAHPFIATLDDHELADGAWRDGAAEHKAEYGPWPERRATAFRVREEWLPVRRPVPEEPERVFRSIDIGDLAQVFVLDTRSRRDQPVPAPAMFDPARSALGPEQRAWLFDGLRSSAARWRVVANPSVMAQTWTPSLPDEVKDPLLKVKLLAPDLQGPDFDQWDGYPAERSALLAVLADGRRNSVVLSGDVHVALAIELNEDPFDRDEPIAVEVVTPSLSSQNLDDKMGWGYRNPSSEAAEARLVEVLPHWRWCELDSHGYVVVDIDEDRARFEWWFVPTVLERSEGERCQQAFEVRHGDPHLVEVAPG